MDKKSLLGWEDSPLHDNMDEWFLWVLKQVVLALLVLLVGLCLRPLGLPVANYRIQDDNVDLLYEIAASLALLAMTKRKGSQ